MRAGAGGPGRRAETEVLSARIAELDFPAPPPVRARLIRLAADGELGYPTWMGGSPIREAFARRMADRYRWDPNPAYVRTFTDVIQPVQAVLDLTTRPGGAVAMHTPCYPPFLASIAELGRRLVPIPMDSARNWEADADRLARELDRTGGRVLILVNPHNPTGHAFTAVELKSLAELVVQKDLLVIADEIYADLVFPPRSHIPFASLDPEVAARTVTLTSASKAFKLAGLCCTVAHVGPAWIRDALARPPHLFGQVSVPAVAATLAAWEWSEPWLNDMVRMLDDNRCLVAEELSGLGIGYVPPDAGYLAWLDCRPLGLPAGPADFFLERARVRLSPGHEYGPGGTGRVRLGFGTSAGTLREICRRMAGAVRAHLREPINE